MQPGREISGENRALEIKRMFHWPLTEDILWNVMLNDDFACSSYRIRKTCKKWKYVFDSKKQELEKTRIKQLQFLMLSLQNQFNGFNANASRMQINKTFVINLSTKNSNNMTNLKTNEAKRMISIRVNKEQMALHIRMDYGVIVNSYETRIMETAECSVRPLMLQNSLSAQFIDSKNLNQWKKWEDFRDWLMSTKIQEDPFSREVT